MQKTIIGLDNLTKQGSKFLSVFHLFNEENLKICFKNVRTGKSPGVDLVTKREYSQNLDKNITELVKKIQSKTYKPKPTKCAFISKDGSKTNLRKLGITSFEDKIIQKCIQEILTYIYNPIFKDCMYGIGQGKSCHNAIASFNKCIMRKPINYVVEVDIRKFFDNIRHDYLICFLNRKILDQNLLKLILLFLKAGTLENGKLHSSDLGTPQGSSMSSVLANVYLHYIIDVWLENVIRRKSIGYMKIIRYCDDFVVCSEKQKDAIDFLKSVVVRLNKFSLNIAEEKTRMVNFGKKQWKYFEKYNVKIKEFDFLGFTHYARKNKSGKWIVTQRTSAKNFNLKLTEISHFIKKNKDLLSLNELWEDLKSKLRGHINYFGISGNLEHVELFVKRVVEITLTLLEFKQI